MLLEAANAIATQSGNNNYLDLHNGLIMTASRGHPMARSGSITGIACTVDITTYTAGDDVKAEARVNGTVVFSATGGISSTGVVNFSATQARGIDTFSADDNIQLSISTVSGAPVWAYPVMTCEIILDD